MTHPLDSGAPLRHAGGTDFSAAERQAFFENVERKVRLYYRDNRVNHFGQMLSVGDQLDLIWHELNTTGTVSKDGVWFNAVKAVKEAHPKDDSAYQKAVADVAAIQELKAIVGAQGWVKTAAQRQAEAEVQSQV